MANGDVAQPPRDAGQPEQAGPPQPVTSPSVGGENRPVDAKSLDLILDIPMTVSVQLGSAKMVIRDLLQLGQGSVVELEKLAGEPLDVLVNQKLVARGEVVVVNDKFGIRLTDVVSAVERVEHLQ